MILKIIESEFVVKLFILLLGIFFASSFLSAQADERNYIGGSFGGSDFHIKDDHASPFIFSSIGITPSIHYLYKGETNIHFAEVSYYYDYLGTSNDSFHDDNHRGRIRYSYLHSITNFAIFNKKIDFFLGGSIGTFLCHSDYVHLWIHPNNARTIESWYWHNSFDITALLEYNFEEREFFFVQLFIPIVSNISRPTYSSSGDFNYTDNDWKFKMFGKTKFFPENFSINVLMTYQRPLFWSFNLQFDYEFYYSFYNEPQDVKMYMNNLRAGLFFCF